MWYSVSLVLSFPKPETISRMTSNVTAPQRFWDGKALWRILPGNLEGSPAELQPSFAYPFEGHLPHSRSLTLNLCPSIAHTLGQETDKQAEWPLTGGRAMCQKCQSFSRGVTAWEAGGRGGWESSQKSTAERGFNWWQWSLLLEDMVTLISDISNTTVKCTMEKSPPMHSRDTSETSTCEG